MNAFDEGRVGLWIDDPSNFVGRATNIVRFANGMFTDCFLPRTASVEQFDIINQTWRPDGSLMKAALYEVPHDLTADAFCDQVGSDLFRINAPSVELDIEKPDDILAQFIRDVVNGLRQGKRNKANTDWLRWPRPTRPFRINIAPNKGWALPVSLVNNDPNLYVAEQCYYGDMSRVSEAEVAKDVVSRGIPWDKFAPCYGAAGPVKLDGTRGITLPSVFYEGRVAAKLKKGIVFQDDLMAEVGLL